MQDAPRHQALDVTIRALVGFAASQPQTAQLLMNETLAGGPDVLDARDQALGEIAKIIEQAHSHLWRPRSVAQIHRR